jgi:peptidoglycan/LPS O-acetylase OafA/YrhL
MELKNINILRGIAALAVVYFHLTGSADLSAGIASSGKYGFLGVEMFFVISGFILPYSMYQSGYRVSSFFTFLGKRMLRIYPCYLVSIVAELALMALTKRPFPELPPLCAHFLFLNGILHYTWISPVFWTLALEFQFYLLIGLFYNAFTSKTHLFFILSIFTVLFSSLFLPGTLVPHWFGMFTVGILLFRRIQLKMNLLLFWILIFSVSAFNAYANGIQESIACLGTAMIIWRFPVRRDTRITRIGLWAGSISYSLYLTHWEFGRMGVGVFRHFPFIGSNEYLRLGFGFGFAVLIAWLFHLLIEIPPMKWSQKIKYNPSSAKIAAGNTPDKLPTAY